MKAVKMNKMHNNTSGFSLVPVLLILVVLSAVGTTGWYVWNKQKSNKAAQYRVDNSTNSTKTAQEDSKTQPTAKSQQKSENELVLSAILDYCKTSYMKSWPPAYKVDPNAVFIAENGKSPAINGNYAVMSTGCDTKQVPDNEKNSGFVAYLEKQSGIWKVYSQEQMGPSCAKFDGRGWPQELIPACQELDGSSRALR